MRTAEEWHDEVCIAADATHGAIVEVVQRIQAEAIEGAARVCDDRAEPLEDHNDWARGYARGARNCAAAIRSLSLKEETSPAPTDRETPREGGIRG